MDLAGYRVTGKNGDNMKSNRAGKTAKAQHGLLLNVARSIGSTLGTIAAKTGSASKPSTRRAVAKKIRSKATKAVKAVKIRKKRAA
jgi:hypothetical protein